MKKYILLIFSFLFSLLGFAQYCVPISNCSDNDYIDDFYFNTISNTNTAGSNCNTDSYIYYTNLSTTVTAGQSYSISMQSGPDWDEGFGVWIDFNQDGDFDDMGEFVFASTTATTALVTGTVNIPSTAIHGPTRMRVRCRYGTTVNSSESCAQFSFGETEDYNVFIENAMPPVADFSAINSNCAPTVSFVDQSQYANSWLWDFGDGNTSTAQNPVHTYASPGNYTVSLTVTNNYGTDMVSYVINVSGASTNLPGPAQCTPQTIDNSLGFGITKVVFNTINNLSANSTAGYEDFTCLQTNLYLGYSYPITVELDNTAEQNVKVWIDFNNDGTFNETNELVVDEQQTMVVQTTITIPNVAITGQPLRMRVASDYYLYGSFTSCDDMNVGQVEDYSVIIEQNTNPPVADFEAVPPRSCDGVVEFIDQSLNIPTAYYWDFGDGNTSIASNPTHTYMNSGVYTVSMTTTNTYGSDMVVHNVTVDFGGNLKPASCTPQTTANCCGYGISRVIFGNIDHTSGDGSEGYQDYSCEVNTTVEAGTLVHYEVRTSSSNPEDLKIWLDFNNDGDFDDVGELVVESYNKTLHAGDVCLSLTDSLNQPLRLRVMTDYVGAILTPCYTPQWGQTEDYAVTVLPNQSGVYADFTSDNTESCDGVVTFYPIVCDNNAQYLWDFGDGNTTAQVSPTHTYMNAATYDVTLYVTTTAGTAAIVKNGYYTRTGALGMPSVSCVPTGLLTYQEAGIGYVNFENINHYSDFSDIAGVYEDNRCTKQTSLQSDQSYSITVYTGNTYSHSVSVWIDFNNNTVFDGNELVWATLGGTGYQSGLIYIPSTVVTDEPLAMRVGAITDNVYLTEPCNLSPTYGQFEDYTVYIMSPGSPPIPNFIADSTESCTGVIQFTDLSSGNPTTWFWDFGDGTTSNVQNPTHTYTSYGYYDVTLYVSNGNGSSSVTYSSYIHYDPSYCGTSQTTEVLSAGMDETSVFPNPFTKILRIKNPSNHNLMIEVYDISGKLVYTDKQNSGFINVNTKGWDKGTYIIHLKTDDFYRTKKIIKQ